MMVVTPRHTNVLTYEKFEIKPIFALRYETNLRYEPVLDAAAMWESM